jgi:hypothetical protein
MPRARARRDTFDVTRVNHQLRPGDSDNTRHMVFMGYVGSVRHVYDLAVGGQTATRALMALLIMAWHGIGFWLAPDPALAFDPTSQPLRRYPF